MESFTTVQKLDTTSLQVLIEHIRKFLLVRAKLFWHINFLLSDFPILSLGFRLSRLIGQEIWKSR